MGKRKYSSEMPYLLGTRALTPFRQFLEPVDSLVCGFFASVGL